LAFDHELPADLPGFLSDSRAKVISSRFVGSLLFPNNDNDDDFSLDDLMAEPALKRTLLSSHSTDAKSSETPVVDDVTQPPDRSLVNQRVKKKIKRERGESVFSLVSLVLSV